MRNELARLSPERGLRSLLFAILILFVSVIFIAGCDDDKCPVCPEPIPEEEHIFYISYPWGDSTYVKAFSADHHKFIDSFWVEIGEVNYSAIIGDYDQLFLAGMYGMKAIDLETKAAVFESNEFGGFVELANNSQYYATSRLQPSFSREIRNAASHQLIYSDPGSSGFGGFSYDSRRYIYFHNEGPFFSYDPVNDTTTDQFNITYNNEPISISRIQPTRDLSKIYMVGAINHVLFLGVTPFGKDSLTVLRAPLKTGGEDFVLSPDGRHIFFTNAPYTDFEFPSQKVEIIDVTTDQIVASIPTDLQNEFDPLQMAVSRDGKYLMVLPLWWTSRDIILVDAVNFTVIGNYRSGDQQIQPWTVCTKQ